MSFLLYVLLLFHPIDDFAITINVADAKGEVVHEALVLLEHTTDQKKWEGKTAENGSFHFEKLPAGAYVVRVIKEGFYPQDIELRLEASKVVDFTLVPVEMLHNEVEVIARPESINTEAVSAQ